YGHPVVKTPHIDSIAARGIAFDKFFVASPVCMPNRASLMTGRMPSVHGARSNGMPLPLQSNTFVDALRAAGYATALVGKWHLGFPPHFGPLGSGYQEFFGPMSGGVDYFTHRDSAGVHDLYEGDKEVHRSGYLTDLLTDRAVDFVKRAGKKPFLLSLHYTAPHWPWEARADAEESGRIAGAISHFDGGSLATYVEMIRAMDEGIGRLMAELDDSTIVVFTSDNGGERFSDSWPLVGGKMDLMEGGIRVPYVVRWPKRRVIPQLAITMDWVATFLDAADVAPHPDYPLDGVSLLRPNPGRELFWRMKFRSQKAMRSGSSKWLSIEGNEFLFDLARDPRERANLARRQPATHEELRKRYADWEGSLPPIPDEAKVSLIGGPADLARPS
ncbi:MAG: sulfatase family protein, partial [Burkholderiales bacterium]